MSLPYVGVRTVYDRKLRARLVLKARVNAKRIARRKARKIGYYPYVWQHKWGGRGLHPCIYRATNEALGMLGFIVAMGAVAWTLALGQAQE